MVARQTSVSTARPPWLVGWFLAWRRMLTTAFGWPAQAFDSLRRAGRRAAHDTVLALRDTGHELRATVAESGRTAAAAPGKAAAEVADSVDWIFRGWRRLLARIARLFAVRSRVSLAIGTVRDSVRVLREPGVLGGLDPAAIDRVASLGVRALLLSATASFITGWITDGALGLSVARSAGALAWAGVRLAILITLVAGDRRSSLRVYAAWAVSLVPFVFGATEGLRFLALGASAWLCLGALEGLGIRPQRSRTAVVWAFGGQAGVVAIGWLLRGGIAAIASLF